MSTPRKRKEDGKHLVEENDRVKILNHKTRSQFESKSIPWVAILVSFAIMTVIAYYGGNSNSPAPNTKKGPELKDVDAKSSSIVSEKIDDEYSKAIERKVTAQVQPGWFKPNETAILRIVSPKSAADIHNLIKEFSSLPLPSKSNILDLSDSFPIFHWNLTKFSNSDRKSKSRMSSLSADYSMLPHCRYQIDPVFVLGSERDKGGMVGSKHDQAIMYVNVSMGDFLRGKFREKMYLYWTGELEYFENAFNLTSSIPSQEQKGSNLSRWNDFHIIEPNLHILDEVDDDNDDSGMKETDSMKQAGSFKTNSSQSSNNGDEQGKIHVRPMLWLSHPGVVAQTHYDTQHNIFLQIQGFKRFHLFPPATELYVYPNIHHAFRQSQIHFERSKQTDETALDVFELVNENSVEAIEVTLGPGDILYIPPFWQHRAESLTLSLSLSILSPSEVDAAIAELFWLQIPFGGELQKTRTLRIRAVIAYIDALFQQLQSDFESSLPSSFQENSNNNPAFEGQAIIEIERDKTGKELRHRFAQSLYHSRFAPLQRSRAGPMTETPRLCPSAIESSTNGDIDKNSYNAHILQEIQLIADSQGNFLKAALHFVDTLQRLEADIGIKRTFLRDYLEHLVRWAVGPQLTAETLLRCF